MNTTGMNKTDRERAAIRAAIQRLLEGTPRHSTGAMSVLQLAVEAQVKRWVLTHKHTDLAEEFRSRAALLDRTPPAFTGLEERARAAEESNRALRQQNRQLRAQVASYARVIHELHTQLASPTVCKSPLTLVPSDPSPSTGIREGVTPECP